MANKAEETAIVTERFVLRPLTPADATGRYLGWLADQDARRYIQAACETHSIDDLRSYISRRSDKADVLFLGIFERVKGEHIGNIKYEPIDIPGGSAEMGILIGESRWRGCGVAREVILASARWLKMNRRISIIRLGVESGNEAAITAYLRTGFLRTGITSDPRVKSQIVRMALKIGE